MSEAQKIRDYSRRVFDDTRDIARQADTVWMAAAAKVIEEARREAVSDFAYRQYGAES